MALGPRVRQPRFIRHAVPSRFLDGWAVSVESHRVRKEMVSRRDIQRYSDEIARRFKPAKIILFGSYAYGKPTPDSDVDLLVVMPCKGRPLDAALAVRLAVDPDFALDLLVRTPAEVRQRLRLGDYFLREITSKGKVLYESTHA